MKPSLLDYLTKVAADVRIIWMLASSKVSGIVALGVGREGAWFTGESVTSGANAGIAHGRLDDSGFRNFIGWCRNFWIRD